MNQPPLFPEFFEGPKPIESSKKTDPVVHSEILQSEWIEHALSALRNIQKYQDVIERLHIFLAHLKPGEAVWMELSQLKTQYDAIQSQLVLARIAQSAADKEYDMWDGRGGMMPESVRLGIQNANNEVDKLKTERETIAKDIITLLSQHFETKK